MGRSVFSIESSARRLFQKQKIEQIAKNTDHLRSQDSTMQRDAGIIAMIFRLSFKVIVKLNKKFEFKFGMTVTFKISRIVIEIILASYCALIV